MPSPGEQRRVCNTGAEDVEAYMAAMNPGGWMGDSDGDDGEQSLVGARRRLSVSCAPTAGAPRSRGGAEDALGEKGEAGSTEDGEA